MLRRTLTPNPSPGGRGAPDNFLNIKFKLLEVTVMKC
ncbi:hypothetical protein XHV734_3947 [Xanthomonas hortorum pv. vitians]|nr:hypothetical protein XHV734_3947 [Xanthomonas hortorum pv. vitians]